MAKKVIVAGHICLDITPVFPEKRGMRTEELLRPGKLLHMDGVQVHTGGCVANTGLAMKFLGADVSLMGKIGTDAFGSMVKNVLKQQDAHQEMLEAEGEATSYTVVLAMPGIDRIFLHDPGANDSFSAADIPADKLREAALLHFGYPPIMRKMYENDGKELVELLRRAKEAGAATSLDLASVDPTSDAAKADWGRILEQALPYVDFFVPSIEELCYMLDRAGFDAWQERAAGKDVTDVLDIEQDIRPLADRCMEMGAGVLLLKCGVPGMYYRTASAEVLARTGDRLGLDLSCWADREGFEKSYIPERVLSATGAGDTSIAAFLTAMLNGYGPEECVRLAAAEGASCVTAYDALSGLQTLQILQSKISNGWGKYEK